MSGSSVPPEQRAARRVGSVLQGKYGIERLLGVGGMATVYMAVHRNGRRIAIKMLHEELAIHGDVRARFVREGYVANAVGHRGAVHVYDDDVTEDGAAFLVMELLEGETLHDRCKRRGGRLPCREVLALAHQLLDVLAAAHERGIVHRDVKPENLFLTIERELKVLDFGIARMKDDAGANATLTGTRIGTPAFMPPEQALGRSHEVDARTDLWAAGATMFALLAGRTVHVADTAAEMIVITATTPPRPLAEVMDDVPEAVAAVVDRALQFTRNARWPGAREMQAALEAAHLAAFGEPLLAAAVGPAPESRVVVPRTEDERETMPIGPSSSSAARRSQPVSPDDKTVESLPTWPSDRSATRRSGAPPSMGPPSAPTLPSTPPPAPSAENATSRDSQPRDSQPRDSQPLDRWRDRRAVLLALLVAGAVSAIIAAAKWSAQPRDAGATTSAASAASATAPASKLACATNADCKGPEPSICRKDEGACVALTSDLCKVLASPADVANDATVWVGAMYPTTAPSPTDYGPRAANAVDLARRDFMETAGGLPAARAGGPKRPIGIVLCDDREAPERAARHLIEDVRVPAILGFGRSKEVLDLATSFFLPKGVLALASNTASTLRDIPRVAGGPRLVWRVTTSTDMMVPAVSATVSELIEPGIRALPGVLAPGEPMRVALVRVRNASGQSYADGYAAMLRFNGKSVGDNGEQFRQIVTPDLHDLEDEREDAGVAEQIRSFLPHVVMPFGGTGALVAAVERVWPESARFRPRYIDGSANLSRSFSDAVKARPELRKRYYTMDGASSTDVLSKYVLRYNEVFSPRMSREDATCAPYDAFYVFAYAAASLGDRAITGTALAAAIPRLLPGGEPIDVGAGGIYPAFYALAAGKNIDLNGAMTSLDFDLQSGDATADFALYCVTPGSATEAPRPVESGVFFRARSKKLEGTAHCP